VVNLSSDIDGSDETDCQLNDGNDDVDDDDESWSGSNERDDTPPPTTKNTGPKHAKTNRRGTTTLVVAPLSLIAQWEEELTTKTTGLSHLVYYGSAKKTTGGADFSRADVVVTTYGTVQSEFVSLSRTTAAAANNNGTPEPGSAHPLLKLDWKRIILDEAHGIKNPSTVVSRACCALRATTRWCVTGTPVQNSLQDVYGLLKFFRHEPWCEASFWSNAITQSVSGASSERGSGNASSAVVVGSNGDAAEKEGAVSSREEMAAASSSMAFGLLRRTKDTLAEDGSPILTLPPIESSIVRVALYPPEREFYNARK